MAVYHSCSSFWAYILFSQPPIGGGGRIMLAAIIMALSFLFFVASSMASSYKKFKIVKDYLSGESSTDDFNYI